MADFSELVPCIRSAVAASGMIMQSQKAGCVNASDGASMCVSVGCDGFSVGGDRFSMGFDRLFRCSCWFVVRLWVFYRSAQVFYRCL